MIFKIVNYLLSLTLTLGYFVSFGQQEWVLKKDQNNIKLWTKSLEGTKLLQFKAETYVKADLDAVYKVLVNVENMHTWYEKVKKVVLLKKIADTEGVYLLEYGLPLPFENRISTLKGSISYDKTKGIIKVNSAYHPHNIPEKY